MKTTPYTLLVFDWDGTLMDSESKILATFHAAADDLGVPRPPEASIRDVIGLDLTITIQRLFPAQGPTVRHRIEERYRHHFNANTTSEPFPGVPETLGTLRGAGFLMAIATGKSRHGLDRELSDTGLGSLFHATICSGEVPSKPHPRMLYEIMEKLAAKPKNTLMIGDTVHDLEMAQNAGVDAAAAAYGVQDRARLLQWAPRICIDSLHELIDWLAET